MPQSDFLTGIIRLVNPSTTVVTDCSFGNTFHSDFQFARRVERNGFYLIFDNPRIVSSNSGLIPIFMHPRVNVGVDNVLFLFYYTSK
jgi:hypothetical protein